MEFAPGQFNESAHFWTSSPEAKNDFSVEGDVVWIRLTQGKCACIDLADWERAKEYRWYAVKTGTRARTLYACTNCPEFRGYLHRLLLGVSGLNGEHRNGNGLDNCRSHNLRASTQSQNIMNRAPKKGGSGFRGVSRDKTRNKWAVHVAGKFLGRFDSVIEAAKVSDAEATKQFGEFARLNFPVAVESN